MPDWLDLVAELIGQPRQWREVPVVRAEGLPGGHVEVERAEGDEGVV